MLPDEVRVASDDAAEHKCDENCVVELSRDWNEIGDQVERQGEVRDQRGDEEFVPSRKPLISQEPRKQDDTVGDEPGDCAGVLSFPGDEEREHHERLHGEGRAERDEKPGPHGGGVTVVGLRRERNGPRTGEISGRARSTSEPERPRIRPARRCLRQREPCQVSPLTT
jgi:hypothetical protein